MTGQRRLPSWYAPLFVLPLILPAFAQEAPPPAQAANAAPEALPPVPPEVQLLYQRALQSIAEGRKDDAREALEQVIRQEAQHAGAWLDLALIHCSLGHIHEAERLFEHIEKNFNPPPGIVDLIAEMRTEGCDAWRPMQQWSATLSRGIGNNINQGSTVADGDTGLPVDLPLSDEFRPKRDGYTQFGADYTRDLTPNGTLGFAQYQQRRYDRLRQYDSASLFLGADTPWRFGDWVLRTSGLLGLTTLGGNMYQQQAQAQLRVDPPLNLPGGIKFNLQSSLTHLRYRKLANYDSNTAELRGQLVYRGELDYGSASAAYLRDYATGARPGGDRQGWLLNAYWRRSLPWQLTGELGYSRQQWNGQQLFLPSLIDVVRNQTTQVWRSSLSYPVGKKQLLMVEARITHNRESIPVFRYHDKQLQVSWQWQGP